MNKLKLIKYYLFFAFYAPLPYRKTDKFKLGQEKILKAILGRRSNDVQKAR